MLRNIKINSPDCANLTSYGLDYGPYMTGFIFNTMKTTKVCPKCGDPKELNEFGPNKRSKDGLKCWCKPCFVTVQQTCSRTRSGLITVIYASQRQRSRKRGHLMPTYSNNELKIFAFESIEFNKLYDNWVESGYQKDLTPSFDRADDYKGYSFDNFNAWMPWKDNKQKGYNDRRNGINNKISNAIIGTHKVTGKVIEFYSINEAERQTGINKGLLSKCCLKKEIYQNGCWYTPKSAGGYTWEFKHKEV